MIRLFSALLEPVSRLIDHQAQVAEEAFEPGTASTQQEQRVGQ